jgi:hypothetical protein
MGEMPDLGAGADFGAFIDICGRMGKVFGHNLPSAKTIL